MIAQGDQVAQQREMDKQSTLLGMAQSEFAGASERREAARAGQMDALSSGLGALGGLFG